MNAVARVQLTFQMLILLQKYKYKKISTEKIMPSFQHKRRLRQVFTRCTDIQQASG